MPGADAPRAYMPDRTAWRHWLSENGAQERGVWVVFDKGSDRKLTYEDIVEEALCFGWIDSLGRRLDERQGMLYLAPRKPGSAWSRPNKERVERLVAAGLMQPAGLAAIDAAKENGTWTALDEVEKLVEPADLATALAADAAAQQHWTAFPRSAKRAILEWISTARKPETRAARIATTVSEAAAGRRANQPRQPGSAGRQEASSG